MSSCLVVNMTNHEIPMSVILRMIRPYRQFSYFEIDPHKEPSDDDDVEIYEGLGSDTIIFIDSDLIIDQTVWNNIYRFDLLASATFPSLTACQYQDLISIMDKNKLENTVDSTIELCTIHKNNPDSRIWRIWINVEKD